MWSNERLGVLPKVIVTLEPGLNPAPVISTDVPTGPDVGSMIIKGFSKDVTLNVFEAEFPPWVALTV